MTSLRPCKQQPAIGGCAAFIACAAVVALTTLTANVAAAQTFSVLYNFTDLGPNAPAGGLTLDRAGNLYGTTFWGGGGSGCPSGRGGCGSIFRLKNIDGAFVFQPLYSFAGGEDGALPAGPLLLTSSGVLYGTTEAGGGSGCTNINGQIPGCGTVFSVSPQPTVSRNVNQWQEHILHAFQGNDGATPEGTLALDTSGRIYGSAYYGGTSSNCSSGCGVVFQLTRTEGWSESTLHNFAGNPQDGSAPEGGVTLDASGNVYGTTDYSPACCGTVWELVANSGWTEEILYSFTGMSDGAIPASALTFDPSGNLYGTTLGAGSGNNGTVFELSSGTWAFNLLYSLQSPNGYRGPTQSPLIRDQAGNLYGTTSEGGAYHSGAVFKLTPAMGGWTYTSLHDFCQDMQSCTDGAFPSGSIVMDASGNLYGSAQAGGTPGQYAGVVWEITP